MAVFAIISNLWVPNLSAAVTAAYPAAYKCSETVWFVETADSAIVLGQRIGIAEGAPESAAFKPGFSGIVIIQLSPNYWGHAPMAGWEWLRSAFERSIS